MGLLVTLYYQTKDIITTLSGNLFSCSKLGTACFYYICLEMSILRMIHSLTWLYSDLSESGHAHEKGISTTYEPFL